MSVKSKNKSGSQRKLKGKQHHHSGPLSKAFTDGWMDGVSDPDWATNQYNQYCLSGIYVNVKPLKEKDEEVEEKGNPMYHRARTALLLVRA